MEDKARVGCTPQRRQQAHRVLPCLIIEHGVITLAERASETALIAPWPSKLTILPGFRPERPGMLHTSPIQSKSAAEPRRRMLMIMMAPLVQRTSNFFFEKTSKWAAGGQFCGSWCAQSSSQQRSLQVTGTLLFKLASRRLIGCCFLVSLCSS